MTEQFLQYVWFHSLFAHKQMTVDGREVEVVSVGLRNNDEGPDAFNAKVKIDGILWVGNVEIHRRSSDWEVHGHEGNERYGNVILHVVGEADCDVVVMGEKLPTVVLEVVPEVEKVYAELQGKKEALACGDRLVGVEKLFKDVSVEKLAVERMQDKVHRFREIVERCEGDVERAMLVMVSRQMGFSVNADAMEMLAMSFPHKILFKLADSPLKIEALLYGQAGMLEGVMDESDYVAELKREYAHLQALYNLKPIPSSMFKLLRLRPYNFPTIKLSQLANLLSVMPRMYAEMVDRQAVVDLQNVFNCEASGYWDEHFAFGGKKSRMCRKHLSKGAKDVLIVNVVVPILFYYSEERHCEEAAMRAVKVLESVAAEKNRITEMFVSCGFDNCNALASQGMIQCYRKYCERKDCLRCPLFYYVMKNNKS